MADELDAALEDIRKEAEYRIGVSCLNGKECTDVSNSCTAHLMLRLHTVVSKVLELAGEWIMTPDTPDWARTRARDECSQKIREAIAKEVLGP